ncbi:MAG: UDP-N-acetylmuramoyl-L-alanine--D-glutamate ligase [Fibrobacter sp.]|nr:UDP-N-acetylmuramoyl-L-alanine--D-glutamate ligase [Fibrobacter sp.]
MISPINNKFSLKLPVGILGFGKEGQSSLQWLLKQGVAVEQIKIFDKQKPNLKHEIEVFSGENYLENLDKCATIIRSAGVQPFLSELEEFSCVGGIVTSQIQMFLGLYGPKNVVGITGTMGKGSCLSMISHIFSQNQVSHLVGGNFGVPALDLTANIDEKKVVILELSSFQLMDLNIAPEVAVVLKTTVDHLDWHRSLDEYHLAKSRIAAMQKSEDSCVAWGAGVSAELASKSMGKVEFIGENNNLATLSANIDGEKLHINGETLDLQQCQVEGKHQLENMAAATLVARKFGVSVKKSFAALQNYVGLPFRLQKIAENRGVTYYNDSYATRPDATIAAVRAMSEEFALILGGSDKGVDFSQLAAELTENKFIKAVALMGQNAEIIAKNLHKHGFSKQMQQFMSLKEAFGWVHELITKGAILLSPASASFGLFANYVQRGEVFNEFIFEYMSKNAK